MLPPAHEINGAWQAPQASAERLASALPAFATYVEGTRFVLARAPDEYGWLLDPTELLPDE